MAHSAVNEVNRWVRRMTENVLIC